LLLNKEMTTITRSPVLITVRSRDLINPNAYGSEGTLNLFQAIQCDNDEVLTCQVINAIIPNSWNNLSALIGNNKLRFAETGDSSLITITISDGNYTIDELMSEVKTQLDANSTNSCTYTLTYSEITNKVSITHDKKSTVETTFDFLQGDTIRRFLGFTQGEFNITSSANVVSDRAVDITDTHNSIFIRSDLNNQKVIESSSTRPSNIIACIPVPLSRNAFFVYDPMNPFEVQLSQNTISSMNIRISWQDETVINLQKADFEIILKINYRRLPKSERVNFRTMTDLNERLRRFEENNRELNEKEKEQIKKNIKNIDIDKTEDEGNVSNIP
jgi:hypothetical protein